jgi:acyl dehydratase
LKGIGVEALSVGDLIAGGWHTAAVFMRLYVDALFSRSASMGSIPSGDTLRARLTVLDKTPSSRNPNRGTVHIYSEVLNDRGTTVMTMKARGLFARREVGGSAEAG